MCICYHCPNVYEDGQMLRFLISLISLVTVRNCHNLLSYNQITFNRSEEAEALANSNNSKLKLIDCSEQADFSFFK